MNTIVKFSLLICIGVFSPNLIAEDLHIHLNADLSINKASGNSILMGIKTALAEHSNKIGSKSVKIIKCDHRGINVRSDRCIKKFLSDNKALVMYTGLHSPPIISNLNKKGSTVNINENQVLTLVPWAAAGVITRAKNPNWIYRLSLDDKYAGKFIVKSALKEGFKRVALLLVDDGWGKYNKKVMTNQLKSEGLQPVATVMIDRSISFKEAQIHLSEIAAAKADLIILVSNAPQCVSILKSMKSLKLDQKISIRSHWGVTGGDLWKQAGEIISKMNFKVIQTSFSFNSSKPTTASERAFKTLSRVFPEIQKKSDLKAPVGFIHAYDLTHLLLLAAKSVTLGDDIVKNRLAVKNKLESLDIVHRGLIKNYKRPFSNIAKDPDGHDALSEKFFKMARYRNGSLFLLDN